MKLWYALRPFDRRLDPFEARWLPRTGFFARFDMATRPPTHWKLFDPKVCSVKLRGTNKEEIVSEIIANFVSGGGLNDDNSKKAHAALEERERGASTGIGRGIAIQHLKAPGLEKAVMSISIHPSGLDWDAVDRAPVQIIFTVFRPERASDQHDPEAHIEFMRWVSRLSQDADFRSFAVGLKNKKELASLLKEKASV